MVEHRRFGNLLPHLILLIGVVIVAFPVYLAVIASTHDNTVIANGQMPLYPGSHGLETYWNTIMSGTGKTTRQPVGTMMLNSLIMALGIAIGKIAISIISAYAIVFFAFPFRMTAFWTIFITLMLPVEVRIFPTYKITSDLHMLDSYSGLILPLIASATATLLGSSKKTASGRSASVGRETPQAEPQDLGPGPSQRLEGASQCKPLRPGARSSAGTAWCRPADLPPDGRQED